MARDYWFAFGTGNPTTYSGLAPTFIAFINNAGTTYSPPAITERASTGLYQISYGPTQTIAFILDGATTGLATSDRYISGVFDPYDQFGVTLNAAFALGTTSVAIGTTLIGYGTTSVFGISAILGYGSTTTTGISTLLGYGLTTTFGISTLFGFGTSTIAFGTSLMAQGFTLFGFGVSGFAQGVSLSAQNVSLLAYGSSLTAQGNSLFALGTTSTAYAIANGLAIGSTASSYGSTSVDPVDLYGYLKRARELAEGNQIYTKATGLLDLYVRGGATLLIEKTISDTSTTTSKT